MEKYRKKPVVIEAEQFWPFEGEWSDDVLKYHPSEDIICDQCGFSTVDHGWIMTLEGGHIVCPGDMVIKGVQGEKYPCKPDIFAMTYEKVE